MRCTGRCQGVAWSIAALCTSGEICDDKDFDITPVRVILILVCIVSLDAEMDVIPRDGRDIAVYFHHVDMVILFHVIQLETIDCDSSAAHG